MSLGADTEAGAARRKALLDERSAVLARRGRMRDEAATRPVLLCLCGPDRYGLALADVAQVIPARACTPLPGAAEPILGLVALSGRVVTVLALAAAMGRSGVSRGGTEEAPAAGHFVLLRGAGTPIALAVDRVDGVVPIPLEPKRQASHDPAAEARLGSGAVSVYAPTGADAGTVVVVDPRRLLRRYLP